MLRKQKSRTRQIKEFVSHPSTSNMTDASEEPLAADYAAAQQHERQQLLEQTECGAKTCKLPGLPLGGVTVHQCRHTQKRIHAPCGFEAIVEHGIVSLVGSDITFPIERLNPQGYGRGPDHDYNPGRRSEICALCVEELDATDNSAAVTAIDPAVQFIYPNVEDDFPADIIDEMLEQAREGSAGPEK